MEQRDLFGNILPANQTEKIKSGLTKITNGEYLFYPDFFSKAESDLYLQNLKEDIEARLLCQKLKVPIQMITKEIYDKVIDRIERERDRLSSDDRSRREKLLDDSMRAQQMYMDNLKFDDLNYNQDFMHELCVLLNV